MNIYRKGSNIVSSLKNYWVLVFHIHNYMDMIESSEALEALYVNGVFVNRCRLPFR